MNASALALKALLPPLVVAAILTLPWLRRRGDLSAMLSIAVAVVSFLAAAGMLGMWITGSREASESLVRWLPVGGGDLAVVGVRVDAVSAIMLVIVTAVALAVQVFSFGYLRSEPPAHLGRYYACQSLFLFSMNLLVLAPNLLQAFLGWELVGASSFLLIGYWWRKASAARAALKAFWVTKLADMGFIIALVILHAKTGAFSWQAMLPAATATLIAGLLFIAVMGKSAQFPLHVWLPDAMEGPTPVSALLHAATMVAAGVFLLVRAWPLFEQSPGVLAVIAHVGAFTAVFAACVAVVQTDIKKVLAYSTCSQLGYMFAGLGAGSALAGFFHLTTHAFFKALLFLAAGSVIHAVHSNELADMGGLARRMKLTAGAFIVGALALAGIPPFAGFFSKDVILEAAAARGHVFVTGALLATAFLTALYMGRVVLSAFFGRPSRAAEHAHESGAWMLGPVLLLAVPSVLLGFGAASFAGLLGEEHDFHLGTAGVAALALAIAGGVIAFMMHRKVLPAGVLAPVAGLARTSAVDRLWLAGYRRAVLGVSAIFGWADRYVVDGLVNVVGWATIASGRKLRVIQTGNVMDYAYVVLFAVAVLAAFGVLR